MMKASNLPLEEIQIFISYGKEDINQVLKINEYLRESDFKTWLDLSELLPGENWQHKIEDAIEKSDFFISVLSNKSIEKVGYFQKELKKAIDRQDYYPENKVYIIPVLIEEIKSFPLLNKIQNVKLYEGFEQGMKLLVKSLLKYGSPLNEQKIIDQIIHIDENRTLFLELIALDGKRFGQNKFKSYKDKFDILLKKNVVCISTEIDGGHMVRIEHKYFSLTKMGKLIKRIIAIEDDALIS